MSSKPIANLMPALYSHRLHDIQTVARAEGYAIAIHGSMQRDLDVIAVPWVPEASAPDVLVQALCRRLRIKNADSEPTEMPHGRLVYTLLMAGACFMDLSVMPPSTVGNRQ